MKLLTKLFRRRPEPEPPRPPSQRQIYWLGDGRYITTFTPSKQQRKLIEQSHALWEIGTVVDERRRIIALAAPLGEI